MNAPVNPEIETPLEARPRMRWGWILLAIVIILVLFFGVSACGSYNNFVTLGKQVDEKWANVESALKRRSDLVPNLVATVKAYAKQEQTVFIEVARARAGLDNARTQEEITKAAGDLSQALSRLMVVVENYPLIKSNENFLQLQDQLEGTENRLRFTRDEYNAAVKAYNTAIKRFPGVMFAGLFGFNERVFFEATEAERQTPNVEKMFNP